MAKAADPDESGVVGNNVRQDSDEQIEQLGLNPEQLANTEAVVFVNQQTNTVTISFRGANQVGDYTGSAGQLMGIETDRYTNAMNLAEEIDNRLGGQHNIQFAGGSHGGGLASAAAIVSGNSAYTFNAVGLHSDTVVRKGGSLSAADSLVDAFFVAGEAQSGLQDNTPVPDAVGNRIKIKPATGLKPCQVVKKHHLQAVIDSLEENC